MLKNIQNLMEKAGWSAEHSMDVPDVSEGAGKGFSRLSDQRAFWGADIISERINGKPAR